MSGPETKLRRRIITALKDAYPSGVFLHIHGNEFQQAGIPDILCCINGFFIGLEVKCPGSKGASLIQEHMIRQIRVAGGWAEVVRSPKEALGSVLKGLSYLEYGYPR